MNGPAHSQDSKSYEQTIARWTVVVGIFTGLLFIATAVSAYFLWQTDHTLHDTLISTNRAWVLPVSLELEGPIKSDRLATFVLRYENIGREPATGMILRTSSHQAPRPAGPIGNLKNKDVSVGSNTECESLSPQGSDIVYPGHSYRSLRKERELSSYEQILNGEKILVIKGCLTYRTFNTDHRAGFCYMLAPQIDVPVEQWIFYFCDNGNFAD
jgi:hypothetical protein